MTKATRMTADEVFAVLEECAIKGERCPPSHWATRPGAPKRLTPPIIIRSATMTRMAEEGRILIEISGKNWRTVTLLEGPHKGMSTMKDPHPHAYVWQSIGVNKVNRGKGKPRKRPGPSAPQLIKDPPQGAPGMRRCVFEGCPTPAQWTYGLSPLCADHRQPRGGYPITLSEKMRAAPVKGPPSDLVHGRGACAQPFRSSLAQCKDLVLTMQLINAPALTAADRAYHRRKREARAALEGELKGLLG